MTGGISVGLEGFILVNVGDLATIVRKYVQDTKILWIPC